MPQVRLSRFGGDPPGAPSFRAAASEDAFDCGCLRIQVAHGSVGEFVERQDDAVPMTMLQHRVIVPEAAD